MHQGSPYVTYFGKVRHHGDFVRRNTNNAPMRALDEWIPKALYFSRTQIGGALDACYDQAAPLAFHFRPRGASSGLVGILHPSRDRVGRKYPFVVGTEVADEPIQHIAQRPVRYSPFLLSAARVVDQAVNGEIEYLNLPQYTDPLGAMIENRGDLLPYKQYLADTPVTQFWERVWGHADDSRKYLLFKNLLDILLPLKGKVPRGFPLVFRFPLCADGRTLHYDASIWLEITLRLLKYPAIQPTFFWTASMQKRTEPFLLLTLGPPAASTLAYLLSRNIDSDVLCDLERLGAQNAVQAALSIPPEYGQLLELEQHSISDFLNRL